jgi:hypothetical protein
MYREWCIDQLAVAVGGKHGARLTGQLVGQLGSERRRGECDVWGRLASLRCEVGEINRPVGSQTGRPTLGAVAGVAPGCPPMYHVTFGLSQTTKSTKFLGFSQTGPLFTM